MTSLNKRQKGKNSYYSNFGLKSSNSKAKRFLFYSQGQRYYNRRLIQDQLAELQANKTNQRPEVYFSNDEFKHQVKNEVLNQLSNPCTFCSVKMYGSGTYTGDNGETVYVDYIQDQDQYCKKHCSNYK